MRSTKSAKTNSFPIRERIREAEKTLCQASDKLEQIRDHFNMEWGDNKCCDLDLALSYALMRMGEARKELNDLLSRRRLGLNLKRGRSWI